MPASDFSPTVILYEMFKAKAERTEDQGQEGPQGFF